MDGLILGGRGMSQAEVDARISAMRNHDETHSGVTNSSGVYSVTFSRPFDGVPGVEVQLLDGASHNMSAAITSLSNTGCTVTVRQRAVIQVLGIDVLGGTLTNVNGQSVQIHAWQR